MELMERLMQDPVARVMNPSKPFMRVVQLPRSLVPFEGVTIYALVAYGFFAHIKVVPAFQMMYEDTMQGRYDGVHTLVVDSSGNTAHAVVRLASAFGIQNVVVVMASDVPAAKVNVFKALSVPTMTPPKGKSVAEMARELGAQPGYYHLNQYGHEGNMNAHEFFTGPEIARVLVRDIGLIAISMGSGGTAGGVARYLAHTNPEAKVLGVRVKDGEQVPGARSKSRMAEIVTIPWQRHVPDAISISRKEAFIATRRLWGAVEPQPGPTSGLAYAGLIAHIRENSLGERLRGKKVAFLCPDDARPYSDVMIAELDPHEGLE